MVTILFKCVSFHLYFSHALKGIKKVKGISFLSACICTLFMSGCGSDSQSDNTSNTYTLTVDAAQINDAITLEWQGGEYEIAPQSETNFTSTGTQFSAPTMVAIPNHYSCEMNVDAISEFHYQASIQCETLNHMSLDTIDKLAYPVTVQYGEQTQIISQGGEATFAVEAGVAQSLVIESTGGPQSCEILGGGASYLLSCEPFLLSYGYFNGRRNLYKISDNHTTALYEFDQPEDVLVYEDYFYLNDKMWFRGKHLEDNSPSIFSASIDNGLLQSPEKTILAATSLTHLNDTAYALVDNEIGDGGYTVQYYHEAEGENEGEWKTALDHSNYMALSGFIDGGDNLQWYLRPKDDETAILLGRILKTELAGMNDVLLAKPLSASFTKVTHNPMFKYDNHNFAVGYDDANNVLIEYTFTASQDHFTDNLGNVSATTVWQDNNDNQYLFYTKENAVKQLSFTVDGVPTTQAFDMSPLEQFIPDWVGGDLTQLVAGLTVSEDYGMLTYLRVGEQALDANEVMELFETRSEVRVLFEKSTQVISNEGHLLVYVGQDATGSVWLIDGLKPYKVEDNVSWDKFVLGYSIENVSPQHASVLDSELRIHEVYKQ